MVNKNIEIKKEVYHGTPIDFDKFDINKGDIGIHFGSKEIAKQAAINKHTEYFLKGESPENLLSLEELKIIKRKIHFKNSLRLKDIRDFHIKEKIGKELYSKGIINKEEIGQDFEYLRNKIKEKGYDGIVYENFYETIGNKDKENKDSYIIINEKDLN